MLCRTTFFAVSLVALAAQANAQSTPSQSAPAASAPAPAPTYYPSYYGHSSTLQEGVQHGYADVLRAEGEMMYNLGRAANQFEEARDKARQNHAKDVEQYFALRELNKQRHKAQHSRPATTKTVAQKKANRPAATVSIVRYDGQIEWPAALAGLSSDARGQLEKSFARRAKGQEVKSGSQEHRRACQAIEKLQAELKGMVYSIPTGDYLSAKKTLESLKSQLTQPVEQSLLTQK